MKTLTATALVSAASACLSSIVFVGALNLATTAEVSATVVPVQTVTVRATRMSAEEKLAYDLEMAQSDVAQVVVVHAKRMSAEEKAKFVAE